MENIEFYQAKTQRIKTISKGIFGGLFALGFLAFGIAAIIASTSPALAESYPNTISDTGRYQMSLQANGNKDFMSWYILVWDTSSGQSKMYFANSSKGFKAAVTSYQLPSSPL